METYGLFEMLGRSESALRDVIKFKPQTSLHRAKIGAPSHLQKWEGVAFGAAAREKGIPARRRRGERSSIDARIAALAEAIERRKMEQEALWMI